MTYKYTPQKRHTHSQKSWRLLWNHPYIFDSSTNMFGGPLFSPSHSSQMLSMMIMMTMMMMMMMMKMMKMIKMMMMMKIMNMIKMKLSKHVNTLFKVPSSKCLGFWLMSSTVHPLSDAPLERPWHWCGSPEVLLISKARCVLRPVLWGKSRKNHLQIEQKSMVASIGNHLKNHLQIQLGMGHLFDQHSSRRV